LPRARAMNHTNIFEALRNDEKKEVDLDMDSTEKELSESFATPVRDNLRSMNEDSIKSVETGDVTSLIEFPKLTSQACTTVDLQPKTKELVNKTPRQIMTATKAVALTPT
jgi:hypothetical protein